MTAIHWSVQAIVWLVAYLVLLVVYQFAERWLIARFQQHSTRGAFAPTFARSRATAVILPVTLLAAATIPLSPTMVIRSWQVEYHLLGDAEVALWVALVLQWLGELLWLFCDRHRPWSPVWQTPATILVDALPTLLLVLNLLLIKRQNNLQLTAWIATQGGSSGLSWTAWTQPLLPLLWLICAGPRSGAGTTNTWEYNTLAFNRALLASALFLGGWQGPFLDQWPWLGLLYTAIKTIAVGAIWTWARATLPRASLAAHSRIVQQVWVPIIMLNLIVTALLAAIR